MSDEPSGFADAKRLATLLNVSLADNADTPEDILPLLGELQPRADEFPDTLGSPSTAPADAGIAADEINGPTVTVALGSSDPNQLRKGAWTDMERRAARGRHFVYRLHAEHSRTKPITSKFTGECQSVRVRLPATRPPSDRYIGTYLGRVEVGDHLLFSIQEVAAAYRERFGTAPPIERVDLITGARFMGRRFSPVSCFLAYKPSSSRPSFYILEGGSASGQPRSLYIAQDLDTPIHQRAGFRFTPMSCDNFWYTGGLELDAAGHPKQVSVRVCRAAVSTRGFFELEVRYAREQNPRRVISPFGLQVEAAMRVLAITEQAGCELEVGDGGMAQPIGGPIGEAALKWDIKPKGKPTQAERKQFCGCPKHR